MRRALDLLSCFFLSPFAAASTSPSPPPSPPPPSPPPSPPPPSPPYWEVDPLYKFEWETDPFGYHLAPAGANECGSSASLDPATSGLSLRHASLPLCPPLPLPTLPDVAGSTPTSADFGDKAWSSVCVSAVKSLAQAASQAQSNTHLTHETVDVRRRRARATGRRTGRARAPRALAMPTTSSCAPGGPACTCAPSASSPSPVCPPRIRR